MTTTYTSTNSRRCASCGQTAAAGCLRTCADLQVFRLPEDSLTTAAIQPADHLTMTGVINALEEGPQSHAKDRPPVPVAYVAMVFLGMVLVALGLVLNAPLSQALWGLVHG